MIKHRREFLHSDDMTVACVFVMKNIDFQDCFSSDEKQIRNTHLNIGTGKDLSIKELAELISKVVGYKGKLFFNTEKPDGTMIKLTDPSKLYSLGWTHKVEINKGIETMYDWHLKEVK